MADPISWTVAAVKVAYSSSVQFVANTLFAAGFSKATATTVANFAVKTAVYVATSTALSAITQPRVGEGGNTLDFKADPAAPVRGLMGYTASGGNKIFQGTWGKSNVYLSMAAVLSLGPIDSYQTFYSDEATVTFAGAQSEATGFHAGYMWQTRNLGSPSDTALVPPTGVFNGSPALTGWGANYRTSGWATAFWTLALAEDKQKRDQYPSGVPDPLWVVRGMKLYDPRQDSTYPGGSGSQRANDWRTWGYTENPYIHALNWVRGHYRLNTDGSITNLKVAGCFVPDAMIDYPAFIDAANVADLNGWTISGEWTTRDNKWQTLAAMLKAGGGYSINRGAKISVMVNKPRTSVYTITGEDVIGQAEIAALTPRRDRKNTIIPRYKSEIHNWEYVAAAEVTSSVYRTEDGGEPRTQEVEYSYVRSAKQAAELAAYDLANTREQLTASLPCKIHLLNIRAGDCVTVDEPEFSLASQKFIVMSRTYDPQTSTVTLSLRSETDGKHAWALGQAANPPPSPSLSAVNPSYVPPPEVADWTITPMPPSAGGSQQPGFIVGGEVPAYAVGVIVEYGPTSTGPWTAAYDGALTGDSIPITGVQPGQVYWVRISYRSEAGVLSDGIVYGPYTAPDLIADTITRFPDGNLPIWNYDTVGDLPTPPDDDQAVAFVDSTAKLYRWNGTAWTTVVDQDDIANGAVTTAKFASGIQPVGIGATLPSTGNYEGRMFVRTTDGKTYTYRSGTWSADIAAVNISGQIIESQIAAGAITTAKFASGIRPVGVGSTLPTLPNAAWPNGSTFVLTTDGKTYTNRSGTWSASISASDIVGTVPAAIPFGPTLPGSGSYDQLFMNTTDKKLYRWDGAAWTTAADGADLVASSVTTNALAAGSVQAAQIGAGAVVASKMYVGDTSNMITDSAMVDPSWWTMGSSGQIVNPAPNADSKSTGAIEHFAAGGENIYTAYMPIEAGKTYYTSVYSEPAGSSHVGVLIYVQFTDTAGSIVAQTVLPNTPTSGQTGRFFSEAQNTAPPGATRVRIRLRRLAGGSSSIFFDSLVVRRAASAELIVDGAITTDKLAANSVVAGKVAAGAISTSELAAGAVNTDKLAANAVTADKLAANSVTAGKVAAGAIETDKLAANAVTSDKILAGAVTAGKVAAGAISTTELAAQSIVASKLALGDATNMIEDSNIIDPSWWSVGTGWDAVTTAPVASSSPAPTSTNRWRYLTTSSENTYTGYMQAEPGAQYYFTGIIQPTTSGHNRAYYYIQFLDASNTVLFQEVAGGLDVAQTGRVKINYRSPPAPALTKSVRIRLRAISGGSSAVYFDSPFLRRAATAELIVDGAITANKVAANAITSDKIEAGAVTASKINVTDLSAISANLGSITVGTANIENLAVTTIKIGNKAVTDSEETVTPTQTTVTTGSSANLNTWIEIHSHGPISVTSGERLRITGSTGLQIYDNSSPARICRVSLGLFRDGSFVRAAGLGNMFEWPFMGNQTALPFTDGSVVFEEEPGAGTFTYSLRIMFEGVNTGFTPTSGSVSSRRITIERFKK